MKTIVIGDLHGDHSGLLAILRATGALDDDLRRSPDTRVIQLGDFIHGGDPRHRPRPGVHDELCARAVFDWCDVTLLGNHELPHVWPEAGFPAYGGQGRISNLLRTFLANAYRAERLVPALAHDGWLLTHGGAMPHFIGGYPDAEAAARAIGNLFRLRLESGRPLSLFDGVGRARGGEHAFGGIFWCDWDELTGPGVASPFPQIVGHTPRRDGGPERRGAHWRVDVGAALSGRVAALV